MSKHQAKAYRITQNWQDAEDVTQTTELNILGRTDIRDAEAYRHRCATWGALNKLRQDKCRPTVYGEHHFKNLAAPEHLEDSMGHRHLHKALALLPKGQRKVIDHLLTGSDLGDMPGSRDTNKSHYRWAMQKLRTYFGL